MKEGGKMWIAGLVLWALCFGPLSFQTVKTFRVLASGLPFAEIERRLGPGRQCVPVKKDVRSAQVEGEFAIHPAEQSYPVSNRVYSCIARFPPGFFLVHIGNDGYVEHLRFYSSDGVYGKDGVRR